MKISDFAKITIEEISAMNLPELRHLVSLYAIKANRRVRQLEKKGVAEYSPAYDKVKNIPRNRFGVRGKNLNQLRNTFKEIRSFIGAKTSTVRGFYAVKKAKEAKFGGQFNSRRTEARFWHAYKILSERGVPGGKKGSQKTIQALYRTFNARGLRSVINDINLQNIQLIDIPPEMTREEYLDQLKNSRTIITGEGKFEYIPNTLEGRVRLAEVYLRGLYEQEEARRYGRRRYNNI